jgi:prolyl oligopeptidase
MFLRLTIATLFLSQFMFAQTTSTAPETRRDDIKETIHGVNIDDPYRWLEDQTAPETRQWIEAQNRYTMSRIGDLPSRAFLQQHLGQLLKVDSTKVPTERAGRYFYLERKADQDQYVLLMRTSATAAPKILFDPHPLAPDHSTSITLEDVVADGTLLAYGLRKGGADEQEIHFLNPDTKKDLADVLPSARYFGISIVPDKNGLYYDIMTDAGPRTRWHKFGDEVKNDSEIFGKGLGPELITFTNISEDGRYIFTTVLYGSSADKTEVYYLDRKSADKEMKALIHQELNGPNMDARFFVVPGADHVYVHTNWRAPNGRILDIDMAHPNRASWNQIVDERPDAVIEDMKVSGGKIAVTYLKNVASEIKFFTPLGQPAGEVTFPTIGTARDFSGRWKGREAFFSFSSFHVPQTVYRFNTASRTKTVFAKTNAPVNAADFELKQVWYESKDKTKVPMFVLYKKGLKLDGTAPTFLTAYGGFNVSRTPEFSALAVTWAQNGGVFASANLRGGGEFGEAWHIAGMKEKKQNVFDDMIAAGEFLVREKYSSPEKLSAQGGSNGGLLMGAMMTQRPDLFRAIVCMYPLLDMVRYQKFLVARFWVPEYGSSDDAAQFHYILKYSPYQNVKKGEKYPAVLFMTGDADTRVAPLHARKMAALMQYSQGGNYPILLHYDTKAGHSEGRSVTKFIEDYTDEISFLWWQLGVTPPAVTEQVASQKPSPAKKATTKQ